MQLAEAQAQLLVPLRAQRLVAEEDHQVLHQGVVDVLELLVGERPGQVDGRNFGADIGRRLAHFDGLIGHRFLPARCGEACRRSDPVLALLAVAAPSRCGILPSLGQWASGAECRCRHVPASEAGISGDRGLTGQSTACDVAVAGVEPPPEAARTPMEARRRGPQRRRAVRRSGEEGNARRCTAVGELRQAPRHRRRVAQRRARRDRGHARRQRRRQVLLPQGAGRRGTASAGRAHRARRHRPRHAPAARAGRGGAGAGAGGPRHLCRPLGAREPPARRFHAACPRARSPTI